jgi:hypothetical protein
VLDLPGIQLDGYWFAEDRELDPKEIWVEACRDEDHPGHADECTRSNDDSIAHAETSGVGVSHG